MGWGGGVMLQKLPFQSFQHSRLKQRGVKMKAHSKKLLYLDYVASWGAILPPQKCVQQNYFVVSLRSQALQFSFWLAVEPESVVQYILRWSEETAGDTMGRAKIKDSSETCPLSQRDQLSKLSGAYPQHPWGEVTAAHSWSLSHLRNHSFLW